MYRLVLMVGGALTVAGASQLLSVVVIHRHGDRNPLKTYKNDPYKDESNWPEGFAQLTKRGMQRQYELGLWLRRRYASFLPPRYSPRTVTARSTDVDRTLMSAQLTLAALFPPTESDTWNEDIKWRPIPVHTAPQKEDPVLAAKKYCKKYTHLLGNLFRSAFVEEVVRVNRKLLDFLSEKSGENVTSLVHVENIHNTLLTQNLAGKKLPEWALEVFPDAMKPLAVSIYQFPCYTREMARLKMGPLFGLIVKHLQGFTENGKGKGAKMVVLSAHDSTLANVLVTMGAFDDEIPSYSSAIMFELHQKGDLGHYVNILFKNSTGLQNLVLKNCEFDCEFDRFVEILEPVTVTNLTQWEEECKNI